MSKIGIVMQPETHSLKRKTSLPDKPAESLFFLSYHDKKLTMRDIRMFREVVYKYYKENNRNSLPWRKTKDPYHILVSEIMLQQTQVKRVIEKYAQFIRLFPDFSSLARASLINVLAAWQGLGYNRRAIALKQIAMRVEKDFSGHLPSSLDTLMTLPGIGRATASAIAAFAFQKPVLFIETNIRRVFLHIFFQGKNNVSDYNIIPFLERTIDRRNPRRWYYALMDYGAMLGKQIENPNKRSAHYQKQTQFEGSDRQLRGIILRTLIQTAVINESDLLRRLNVRSSRAHRILLQLQEEGFIKETKKGFTIV